MTITKHKHDKLYADYTKLKNITTKLQNDSNSQSSTSVNKRHSNDSKLQCRDTDNAVVQRIHAYNNHLANINRSIKNQKQPGRFLQSLDGKV